MKQTSLLPFAILLFPLLGTLITGLFLPVLFKGFDKVKAPVAGGIATFMVFLSFIFSIIPFLNTPYFSELFSNSFTWLTIGNFHIDFELRIDRLSSILLLVITGVGSLIHLYSIGYMAHDKSVTRYFAYLNLFTFFMLLLVLASSLPIMFFGWEGVGLSSYLLIGFWYQDEEKALAGEKAFIMNRIGDLSLLLGMFLLYGQIGTLNFNEINIAIQSHIQNNTQMTIICLLLLAGATGKSAQLPLHTWLPDAMMGPTPVSALIHAATMVTAGVYMIVRLHPLFLLSQDAMTIVAWIGAITALLAATIAIAQNDIKKVLAYSTISQLGFMFLACGVGAFCAAIFHLVTHAFFKALLFLGAGSVIHALSGEQDMTKMGNLRRYIPQTFGLMLVGAFALSGLPLFSGFFSKDEILSGAINLPGGSHLLFGVAFLTAFLTAIYTARMLIMTFGGRENIASSAKKNLHESPKIMLIPLYFLAAGATFGGFFGHNLIGWLNPFIVHMKQTLPVLTETNLMLLSSVLALGGLLFGLLIFKTKSERLPNFLQNLLRNKYYIDEIYDLLFSSPFRFLSSKITPWFETKVFEGNNKLLIASFRYSGEALRKIQSGDIQIYMLFFVIGGAALLTTFLFYISNL